jgi:hypothetical protein
VAYASYLNWRVTDAESDPLTFAIVSGPAWLSIGNPSNGKLEGTPGAGDVGVNVFVVSVSDGVNPAVEATMNLEVFDDPGQQPPAAVSNPAPADGSRNIVTPATLSWDAASGADSYNVYFGTTSGSLTFMTGSLPKRTWHYWRVDAVNANGTTTGTEWSFKSK